MEKIVLNNVQLDFLARHDPILCPHFYGTVACDKLPRRPRKDVPVGYIVNTDPHDMPGKHWIALWTHGQVCEVMDSYALPLRTYETTAPLEKWLRDHWKFVQQNSQSLQSLYSQSCGDYALMFLRERARGHDMRAFLRHFTPHDYVHNDHKVGQMLKELIQKEIAEHEWRKTCQKDCHQDSHASRRGVRHLI